MRRSEAEKKAYVRRTDLGTTLVALGREINAGRMPLERVPLEVARVMGDLSRVFCDMERRAEVA